MTSCPQSPTGFCPLTAPCRKSCGEFFNTPSRPFGEQHRATHSPYDIGKIGPKEYPGE